MLILSFTEATLL